MARRPLKPYEEPPFRPRYPYEEEFGTPHIVTVMPEDVPKTVSESPDDVTDTADIPANVQDSPVNHQSFPVTRQEEESVRIYNTRIQDLPQEDRPRERLWAVGAEHLASAELIAILLRVGAEGQSAVRVAEHLLSTFEGLRGIGRATLEELAAVRGVGMAKAAQIKAGIELGKRLVGVAEEARVIVDSPRTVYNLLAPQLLLEKREHLLALLLDARNGLIRTRTVSIGDLTSAIMNPRETLAEAVRHGAAGIILAHNHPSGDPSPSSEDIASTSRMAAACSLLSIVLHDHVVLGDGQWHSFRESGLLS